MPLDGNQALIRTGAMALAALGASFAFAQAATLVLNGPQEQGSAVVPAASSSLLVQVQAPARGAAGRHAPRLARPVATADGVSVAFAIRVAGINRHAVTRRIRWAAIGERRDRAQSQQRTHRYDQ